MADVHMKKCSASCYELKIKTMRYPSRLLKWPPSIITIFGAHLRQYLFTPLCDKSADVFWSGRTETTYPLGNDAAFSPSPSLWQAPVYFLFLCTWLLLLTHIGESESCVSFGDWSISLSIMSSRVIHIVGSSMHILAQAGFPMVFLIIKKRLMFSIR